MTIDCCEIIPNRLWVGGLVYPEDIRLLAEMGITHVVSLQSDDDLSTFGISIERLLEAYVQARIELRRVATRDFDREALAKSLAPGVQQLASALEPLRTRVYCHCTAGINRSPTVVAAYLMWSRGMSPEAACDVVAERRHCSPDLSVLRKFHATAKGGS